MRPFLTQILNAPARVARSLTSVSRREADGERSGHGPDPFDRLTAMVAAERRREALRRMRATA